jgi:hypothetical protein
MIITMLVFVSPETGCMKTHHAPGVHGQMIGWRRHFVKEGKSAASLQGTSLSPQNSIIAFRIISFIEIINIRW